MNKIFAAKRIYCLLIPIALLMSFTPVADRANFSGTWKLDEGKSDLGQFAGFTSTSIKVDQKENEIVLNRVNPGFNGGDDIKSDFTLGFDGKAFDSEGFGGSKRKTSASWSADGQTLTINSTILFERDGQTNEFKSAETWTLTNDGILSIVTNSSSPMGENTTKAMYKK